MSSNAPRKTQEPYSRVMRLVCLPIQPSPARSAQALSIIGALSTQTRPSVPGARSTTQASSALSFSRSTSW